MISPRSVSRQMALDNIDKCLKYSYINPIPPMRGVTGDNRLMGRERFLRAGLVTPLPGGLGIDPLDIMVGVPGAWLRRG